VHKLVRWTSENIKNEMKDSFTALEVLRSREGECQSHANLYTAFARSREIPTKVVTGLVYSERHSGFLYHAWAESYVNGWLAVDPTLKQIPADATHVKIAGTSEDYSRTVLKMVGKVKIEVLEYK
jgi:transglutaminase-like putative cysteine protease